MTRIDGDTQESVSLDASIHNVVSYRIQDDWLYYLAGRDDKNDLYRQNINGGASQLVAQNVMNFAVDGDAVFYSSKDTSREFLNLYRILMTDHQTSQYDVALCVGDSGFHSGIWVDKGTLYFIGGKTSATKQDIDLCKIKEDGSGFQQFEL